MKGIGIGGERVKILPLKNAYELKIFTVCKKKYDEIQVTAKNSTYKLDFIISLLLLRSMKGSQGKIKE